MRGFGIFLVVSALVAGIVGCGGGDGNNGGDSYTLIVDFTDGGTVTVDDVPIPGKAILPCDAGAVVNLNATPSAGYRFVEWTGNVSSVADANVASTTVTMGGDYSITANFAQGVVVAFADPNLEVAIREVIGKPIGEIYECDLLGLTSLDTTQRNIMNLGGLEHCTSLTELYLWDNQISDISTLANLTSLANLNLWGNYVSDISTLAGLTSLTYLTLDNNDISDISTLAGLTSLAYLFLPHNQISDISPLSNLTGLLQLDLTGNQIIDISSLANLTSLEFLVLERNQIIDILALVDNEGLSEWDWVLLTDNPLSSDSVNIYIPQLEARGVTVTLHH